MDAPIGHGRLFTYLIPHHLEIIPGQMVQVPFGRRMVDGIVFQISKMAEIGNVKFIEESDTLGPVLSGLHLELAQWISDYYRSPLYSAVALMLPPGFRNRTTAYINKPQESHINVSDTEFLKQLLPYFSSRRHRVKESEVRKNLSRDAQRSLERYLRLGSVTRSWAWRLCRADTKIAAGCTLDSTVVNIGESPLPPNSKQEEVLNRILPVLDSGKYGAFLLQGVTGSGKTEIYLQALARCLSRGKKAIVLVPEISLTPQTLDRFLARFPGRAAVLHSRLSQSEHKRVWWGIHYGHYDVVIGSRSAIFAPIRPLGLIVIDEEHEWTYKQQDHDPRYHARAVALRMAQYTGGVVLLGSATPDVGTYRRALSGKGVTLLTLPDRIGYQGRRELNCEPKGYVDESAKQPQPGSMAQVHIVDMRQELQQGNRSIFSLALQSALKKTIRMGDQVILFINRRGASSVVQCRDCGHVMRCRSCEMALTYHSTKEMLLCHQCGRHFRMYARCPKCTGSRIMYLGLGTQQVVKEVEGLLPNVLVLRWDQDVATVRQSDESPLQQFSRGGAQVLVGTQMVAKSLHIPSVTLVGVVLADIGLHLPDFRSAERMFQTLCQVAGRAGRGPGDGVAIIQTYRPDYYGVILAAKQDYRGFFIQEQAFRKTHRLPPFSRLIHLVFGHTNESKSRKEAERVGLELRHQCKAWDMVEADVIGPAPAYPSRIRGRYRWHMLLRGPNPRVLLDKVDLPAGWVVDIDPVSVL